MVLRLSPRAMLAAVGVSLVVIASACGSSGSASTTSAAAPATTTATTAASTGGAGAPAGQSGGRGGRGGQGGGAFTAFTDCLSQRGVSVPDVSLAGGNGGPPADGSFPRRGGNGGPPASGSFPGGSVPGGGVPNGSFPANGQGGGGGFDPTTMILRRLGLDASDATVKAAADACSSTLDGAFGGRGGQTPPAPSSTTA